MKDHLQNKINSGQMWAISGRKGSGKWELAKILIDQGSVRISMADFLKKSIAKLYEIDEIWTTDQSKKEEIWTTPLIWNKEIAKKYSDIIEENIVDYHQTDKKFTTIRDALQFIGSDVLKSYDNLFHVKKTCQNLSPNENYVCDDIRFPEERDVLKQYNPDYHETFIIKPDNWAISNHISEISIDWTQFDHNDIIVNDSSLEQLKNKFKTKLKKQFKNNYNQSNFCYKFTNNSHLAGFCYYIMTNEFAFSNLSKFDYSWSEDFKSRNPYIIENLKFWHKNHLPVMEKEQLENYWRGYFSAKLGLAPEQ